MNTVSYTLYIWPHPINGIHITVKHTPSCTASNSSNFELYANDKHPIWER